MPTDTLWKVGPLSTDDAPAMRALFAESFGIGMTDAFWQWKYGDGHGLATGVWNAEGGLTAHYGGMPRALLDAGQPCLGVQIGDVMVRQRDRSSLSRKGPFFLAASRFLDDHVGNGKPYRYGFGFPNQRAMSVAERLGLYGTTGRICELAWSLAESPRLPWWLGLVPLASLSGHEAALSKLWQAMAASLPDAILGVRDLARLQYRYLDHPDRPYGLWLLRHHLTRRPLGLVVLRRRETGCEWIDLVAPTANWNLCALATRHLAHQQGCTQLTMWITEAHRHHFDPPPAQNPLDVIVPCNLWSPGPDAESQRNRWFLLAGDTDFR